MMRRAARVLGALACGISQAYGAQAPPPWRCCPPGVAATLALPPPVDKLEESILPDELTQEEEESTTMAKVRKDVRGFLSMGDLDLEQVKNAQQEDPELAEVITWIHGSKTSREEIGAKSEDLQKYHSLLGSLYIDEAGLMRLRYRYPGEVAGPQGWLLVPANQEL